MLRSRDGGVAKEIRVARYREWSCGLLKAKIMLPVGDMSEALLNKSARALHDVCFGGPFPRPAGIKSPTITHVRSVVDA